MESLPGNTNRWGPLTRGTVKSLAVLIDAAEHGMTVRRYDESTGEVISGTVRHLVTDVDTAVLLGDGTDIRDSYLRVTSRISELFWPVMELGREVGRGGLAFDRK